MLKTLMSLETSTKTLPSSTLLNRTFDLRSVLELQRVGGSRCGETKQNQSENNRGDEAAGFHMPS
jgi:hypothetical protein